MHMWAHHLELTTNACFSFLQLRKLKLWHNFFAVIGIILMNFHVLNPTVPQERPRDLRKHWSNLRDPKKYEIEPQRPPRNSKVTLWKPTETPRDAKGTQRKPNRHPETPKKTPRTQQGLCSTISFHT